MEGEFLGVFLREKFQGFSFLGEKVMMIAIFFFFEIWKSFKGNREKERERVRKRKKERKEFCCLQKHEIERIFLFILHFISLQK